MKNVGKFRNSSLLVVVVLIGIRAASHGQAAGQGSAKPAAPTRFTVIVEGPPAGKAPDVILIPGLASSRDVYAAEVKLLAPEYRLHRIQVAGFAGEPAGPNASGPILGAVVEELHQYIVNNRLQHPAVIGHSLGGLLGLMLAKVHPEDKGKLLIVDTFPFYGVVFGPSATVESLRPQAQAIHNGMIGESDEQFAASQPQFSAMLVASPEGRKAVTAASLASDRKVFADAMLEDLETDLRLQIAEIKTPTTVLYPYMATQGAKADIDARYTSAYAAMPDVHLKRIDDSLHFIMYDQPAAFHAAVLSFLESPQK